MFPFSLGNGVPIVNPPIIAVVEPQSIEGIPNPIDIEVGNEIGRLLVQRLPTCVLNLDEPEIFSGRDARLICARWTHRGKLSVFRFRRRWKQVQKCQQTD